jgi:hypothetical protein
VKKYKAHDEANECRIGDTVQIIESKVPTTQARAKSWLFRSLAALAAVMVQLVTLWLARSRRLYPIQTLRRAASSRQ